MSSKNAQTALETKPASTGAKPPVETFRLGRIKAAVWENEVDQKKDYNVSFARTYMDEDKQFHDTDSFGRDDLPLVAKLSDMAHTWIYQHGYLSAECAAEQPASENRDDRP